MRNTFHLFILMLIISTGSAFAQKIQGIVSDNSGETLPGVNVVIQGTSTGVTTSFDGKFSITVKKGDKLEISYIGYKTEVVTPVANKIMSIILQEESVNMSEVEVVAVGYGDVRRADLTGSISKASMSDLVKVPNTNIAESLGGRIAGVNISSTDGGLGADFNITIRGAGSLTQSTAPLYVVDGFPQESSSLNSINPNDIESIDILKDASSTAIYGSRGANGVVIITTKKGKAGKMQVSYNGNFNVGKILNPIEMMDGYEYVKLQTEVIIPSELETSFFADGKTLDDYRYVPSYDWQKEIFRTAIGQSHHVSMSGKQEDLRYSVSLSYADQEGIIINSDEKKYQGRINFNQRLSKSVVVSGVAAYTSTVLNGANPSTSTWAASNSFMYSVWGYQPLSSKGYDLMEQLYDPDIDSTNDYRFNPVLSAKNEVRQRTTNNLQTNLSVEWEIIKSLKLKVMGGYSARDYKSEDFNGSNTKTGNTHPNNTQSRGINAKLNETENRSYLNENTLSYQKKKNNHSYNILAGTSLQRNTSYTHGITAEQISNESFGMAGIGKGSAVPVVTSGKGENTMLSYFSRFNYNYNSLYYLTASFRADGSSKFAKTNRWGYFPSASGAWAFGRESFITDNISWLSNGKLRVSWGQTGNNRIGDFDYLAQLITTTNDYNYAFDSALLNGYVLGSNANSNLKWETTDQTNIGIDLSFFKNRINLTADYYIKDNKNLLLKADVSASSGFKTAMMNIGHITNKGVELTLETVNITTKNFNWTSNFNIAFNENKIKALSADQTQMTSFVRWDSKYDNMPAYISQIGKPAGQMYGFVYDGTYKYDDFNVTQDDKGNNVYTLKEGIPYYVANCQPGDPKYKNLSGDDNIINDDDKTIIGNGQPLHTGGFTNNFSYKNFDLNIFFKWSYGNDIINANRMVFENPHGRKLTNMFASYTERWTPENPNSNMIRSKAQGSEVYSSQYVEDGSYLKLKSVTLGYTFSKDILKKCHLNNARIFVAAENIFTLSKYSGFDPEVSVRHSVLTPGFDWSSYPRSFNASVGLNLTF